MENKHTKGKWNLESDSYKFPIYHIYNDAEVGERSVIAKIYTAKSDIQGDEAKANAERIVHCVNNFDTLLKALTLIRDSYDNVEDLAGLVARQAIDSLK